MSLSNDQIVSLVQDSLAAGIGGAEIGAALSSAGVSQSQAAAATGLSADVIAQSYAGGAALSGGGGGGGATQTTGGGSSVTSGGGQTYSDSQVAQALAESVANGFTVEQAIQGGMQNYGISRDQANRAAAQYISTSQTGSNASAGSILSALNSGSTIQQVQNQLNQSLQGQNFDTQGVTSAFRQTLGRNPTQEEYQYFQSLGQSQGLSVDQLRDIVRTGSTIERMQRGITQDFTNLTSADFEADPFGGRFGTTDIYGIPTNPADRINISNIDGRQVQFVSPITQLAVISSFANKGQGTTKEFSDAAVASYLSDVSRSSPREVIEALNIFGIKQDQLDRATALIAKNDPSIAEAGRAYTAAIAANPAQVAENAAAVAAAARFSSTAGQETLSVPRVTEAVNRAFQAGSLTNAEYSQIVNSLSKSTNPADIRNILATPQGSVVIDAIYGQQTGEDDSLTNALSEARLRQAVLSAQDPGYYQASDELGRAYQAAGLNYPFMSDAYQANTMMTQQNAVTPQNFNQQVNELLKSLGQQFGGAETMQTPQTGQYYSETGLQPGFTPFGTEGTTFRSGVAGYVPQAQLPTQFNFGAAPVNATFQQYRPGAFQPEGVKTGGFITGYGADQQPIYSTYNNPNVNVGGATSTLNPFTPMQASAIGDLQTQLDAINAANAARNSAANQG